jgi:hypothetical protein
MSKGSKQRPTDAKAYSDNYDKIFKKSTDVVIDRYETNGVTVRFSYLDPVTQKETVLTRPVTEEQLDLAFDTQLNDNTKNI